MISTPVGGTDVELSRLGFGAAAIGNLYTAVSEEAAAAAVDAAWQVGIRSFDTAPHYGLGLSERRLGAALAGRPREEVVVSSKVGRLLVDNPRPQGRDSEGFDVPDDLLRVRDYSRDGVLRSIEASLTRTGLDRLDVVYVHDPDEHQEQALTQALPALARLREEKVVRAIGVGMNSAQALTRFVREASLDVVMLAGRYTLLDQSALADLLPAAEQAAVAVVAVGVFNSGLLAQDVAGPQATFDYRPAAPAMIERANRIAVVCREHATTLPAAALAFPFGHPAVVNVTVGMRSAQEVRRNAALLEAGVPADLWPDLRAQGLLADHVPVPG